MTMNDKDTPMRKILDLLGLNNKEDQEAYKEIIPFFVMITGVLVWMYTLAVPDQLFYRVAFTVLMLIHLFLYWGSFLFITDVRRTSYYFFIQGAVAFILVLLGRNFGLTIGLYSALIGTTMGMSNNRRQARIAVTIYILLSFTGVLYVAGINSIPQWVYSAIPSILVAGFTAYMFKRQVDARMKAQGLLRQLQDAHAQLEDYTLQVEELTLTAERQRMARELHDTLAQGLAGMVLQLEAVSTHIQQNNSARAQEILHRAMAQSRTTLAEARQVIDDLRSGEHPQQTLGEKLLAEADRFEKIAHIPCERLVRCAHPLPPEDDMHVVRIAAEAFTNIRKHAHAQQVWLRLVETPTGCTLEIEDDGRGFNPQEALGQDGHYGLLGIQERANLLQAALTITSQPGEGTQLRIEIPFQKEQEITHDA